LTTKSAESLFKVLEERLDPEFWRSTAASVSVQCRLCEDGGKMYRVGLCSWRPSLREALEEFEAAFDAMFESARSRLRLETMARLVYGPLEAVEEKLGLPKRRT
jgi:hypothetical protein